MKTYEIVYNGETFKLRRKSAEWALAEIAYQNETTLRGIRESALIRVVARGQKTEFVPAYQPLQQWGV